MIDLKMNFRNKFRKDDLNCPLKCGENDSQQHLLHCDKIQTLQLSPLDSPKYDQLFSNGVLEQIQISALLEERFRIRKMIIKQEDQVLRTNGEP